MQVRRKRRVHGAELKAKVMAECRQPGASVASVALAHGLNANLVRTWLDGRGLKRAGLAAPSAVELFGSPKAAAAMPSVPLSFVPVELTPPASAGRQSPPQLSASSDAIVIELRQGGVELSVRWPVVHAGALPSLAACLRELYQSSR